MRTAMLGALLVAGCAGRGILMPAAPEMFLQATFERT